MLIETLLFICLKNMPNPMPQSPQSLRTMYLQDPSTWTKPWVDKGIIWEEIGALPDTAPYPDSNPYSESKFKLGEKLFNDPLLSKSGQIACASCHDKELGFGDGRKVSYGHDRQLGERNAPSVAMSAFGVEKFWDGRAQTLEEQALMPIVDPKEMAYDPKKAAQRIAQIPAYKQAFKEAFGTETITPTLMAQAIATYERGLMPRNKQFDRFLKGSTKAMNDQEIQGLHLFRTKGRCMNCHNGVAFSDQSYHNLGLSFYGRKFEDLGRYNVSKDPQDVGRFKTPSLRGVGQSKPYMHNGLFPHLRGVINSYNAGMFRPKPTNEQETDPLFPTTDPLLRPLNLTEEEIRALEAFLNTL